MKNIVLDFCTGAIITVPIFGALFMFIKIFGVAYLLITAIIISIIIMLTVLGRMLRDY